MTVLTDQAQALRELAAQAAPAEARRARIVAVTSGKGGVGKSNVSVNLAIRLSQMGTKVVLIDGDLGTANADVLMRLGPGRTLAHVVAGRQTLQEAMIDAPGGFRLIPGASGLAQMAALSDLERSKLVDQIHELEAQADIILIDTGAGVSPNVLGLACAADQLLVVTTPEPTSITDAYAVIKTMHARGARPDTCILVNMVQEVGEGREVFHRLDEVCRRYLQLSARYVGHVMFDHRVSQAVRAQTPFMLAAPSCPAAHCIDHLARRMARHGAAGREESLWLRLSRWLSG